MTGAADVTVVIPVKDRAERLRIALDSVAAQTWSPAEVIVVDDGSTDDTAAVARAAGATVVTHERPQGSGRARNSGIAAATTRWVALLDSDDIWHPRHLELLRPGADGYVLVTASALAHPSGRVVGYVSPLPRRLSHRSLFFPENQVCTSGALVDVAAVQAVGGFNPLPRAQDLDLWIRLLDHGRARATGKLTVTYVSHAGQTTHDDRPSIETANDLLSKQRGQPWYSERIAQAVACRRAWDARSSGKVRVGSPREALYLGRLLGFRRAAHLRGALVRRWRRSPFARA